MALLLLPVVAWTAFSLLYFGFPLPMTVYNKLGSGLSHAAAMQNGLHYYLFTLRNDAPVLPIVLAALVWLASRDGASRALAAGVLLHLLYTLYTGADYMGGRFRFVPPAGRALCSRSLQGLPARTRSIPSPLLPSPRGRTQLSLPSAPAVPRRHTTTAD